MFESKPVHRRIKAQAMEVAREAYSFKKKEDRIPREWSYTTGVEPRPGFWPPSPPENRADNPSLHNPLLRQERMGCGWLGAIFEWEGVLAEESPEVERKSWLILAEEEGKSPPPEFLLRRVEGMKSEQAVSEVLCWARDPAQTKRIAARKEEIRTSLESREVPRLRAGSREFVDALTRYKIPMALVSTRPRKAIETAIGSVGIGGSFEAVVAAEDVHRGKPDPEMFVYALQLMKFIPERCIVFGSSNQTVEAAHEARMKCVAVASNHPAYELGAADLVVRRLDELTVVDLKNLAAVESAEFEPEMEMEEEEEDYPARSTAVDDDDGFW